MEESLSHDHDPIVKECKHSMPHHLKEKIKELIETNYEITPKVMCTKTQAAEMDKVNITREKVKNCVVGLKHKKTKDSKFSKDTIAGINAWAERHCSSNDAKDLEDGNKLIVCKQF